MREVGERSASSGNPQRASLRLRAADARARCDTPGPTCFAASSGRRLLHAVREQLRLPQDELVVEQRQRLRREPWRRSAGRSWCSDRAGRRLRTSGTAGRACDRRTRCGARLAGRPLRLFQMPLGHRLRGSRRGCAGRPAGRRSVRSSAPLAAMMASRTISASSRWMPEPPQVLVLRILLGGRPHPRICDDIWYASDVIMRRCICLMLQPRLHELHRQPVEQLRVSGRFAHLAEVVQRRDDAAVRSGDARCD